MTSSIENDEIKMLIRGQSFLSPDTRLECFLRGAKFLAKNLRGLKITRKILNFFDSKPSIT